MRRGVRQLRQAELPGAPSWHSARQPTLPARLPAPNPTHPPAEGVRAVFFPWLASKPRLSAMQRQAADDAALARKLV